MELTQHDFTDDVSATDVSPKVQGGTGEKQFGDQLTLTAPCAKINNLRGTRKLMSQQQKVKFASDL